MIRGQLIRKQTKNKRNFCHKKNQQNFGNTKNSISEKQTKAQPIALSKF